MAWDSEKYRREVLGPARLARRPPADLFVRYGFTDQLPAEPAFIAQVAEVVREWKKLKSKPIWNKLIDELLNKHAELERAHQLTPDGFRIRRRQVQKDASQRLKELAGEENATHVGPAVVARLRDAVDGADDVQVRQALAAADVKVIDRMPDLPAGPPARYAELARELQKLNLKLSAEVVFTAEEVRGFRVLGGFRFAAGRRLDQAALTAAVDRSAAMRHDDPAKTPTNTVLTVLKSAQREGALDALLLWEVIGLVRPLVDAGFGQKRIAKEAINAGLDRDEAGVLAAALVAEQVGQGAAGRVHRQIQEDLAAGRLRSAQLQAVSLAPEDDVRVLVETSAAELAALLAQADAERDAGRTEAAAQLLADAVRRVTDDPDLADRLAALAPPPPPGAQAVVDGNRVLVSWQPSPAKAGRLRYRVRRAIGRAPGSPAEGVEVATDIGELHAADESATVGADLYYAVFAGRGGPNWSPSARTARVVLAPDVAGIDLRTTADAVSARWGLPTGASQVQVVRVVGGRETRIESDLTGFNDNGLTAGTEYLYKIVAVYLAPDGTARTSAGVVKHATPTPTPVPVADLTVEVGVSAIVVSWVPPPFGRVDLLVGSREPLWRSGTELTQPQLDAFGQLVPGAPRSAGSGRVSVEMPAPRGRRYLLAVTRIGSRSVAGAWLKLGMAAPIDELRAQRLLDEAQLSWIWPEGAADSIIAWPGGERRCSRRVYDDEGGVTIPVGPDEVTVRVSAVHPDSAADLVAFAVPVTIPARKAQVRYRWLKAGPTRPGRRMLELTTDRPCELPELVVVRSTAAYPPDELSDGIEVTRLPPASVTPGVPLKLPVDLPKKATGYLACFTAAGCDAGLLLFPPPPNEMRIR